MKDFNRQVDQPKDYEPFDTSPLPEPGLDRAKVEQSAELLLHGVQHPHIDTHCQAKVWFDQDLSKQTGAVDDLKSLSFSPGKPGTPPPPAAIVLRTPVTAPLFFDRIHHLLSGKIITLELDHPAKPKGGLSQCMVRDELLNCLKSPGARLFTLEAKGQIWGCCLSYLNQDGVPQSTKDTLQALAERRAEQDRPISADHYGYVHVLSLHNRALRYASKLAEWREEHWGLRPQGQNGFSCLQSMFNDALLEQAHLENVDHLTARVRFYPNLNERMVVEACGGSRPFSTTSAVTDYFFETDGQGAVLRTERAVRNRVGGDLEYRRISGEVVPPGQLLTFGIIHINASAGWSILEKELNGKSSFVREEDLVTLDAVV